MSEDRNVNFEIDNGRVVGAKQCHSPNFSPRDVAAKISLLVIHNISLPFGQFGMGCVEQLFCNELDVSQHEQFRDLEGLCVSAHCFIDREGRITQFVSLADKAWHAGKSVFNGLENCNDFSIGIELEGTDFEEFTNAQYEILISLTKSIMDSYPAITVDRIVGHSDIAPGRKTDPGPYFKWAQYREGLS